MTFWFKIKQFFYSLVLNGFEFVFFFTRYWWWKLHYMMIANYYNQSGFMIYEAEYEKTGNIKEENFTFGETTPLPAKLILDQLSPEEGQTVYDLGSGRGFFLFSAYFLYNLRGVGVELFQTYVNKSIKIRNNMKVASLIFRQGNFAQTDLFDADIVYLTATTIQEDILNEVFNNLRSLREGATVIIVHKKIPMEEDFVLFYEGDFPFTWGTDRVYFYRRKAASDADES